ncbi:alpha-amylase 3, chloroplastic [Olea europaea subsp. europaea]|uniref:alpha-amylase n=3 Tax=Olea europaea subsp. europaea TaxID=158383 RepID=A0A8S0UWZ8_OLEEU|nr:alpha-amylase 3, chloroplastic [Olea europaea subsp. europaea]
MSIAVIRPLFRQPHRLGGGHRPAYLNSSMARSFYLNYAYSPRPIFNDACSLSSHHFKPAKALSLRTSSIDTAVVETSESSDFVFSETFQLKRPQKVEGKITIRLESGNSDDNWRLTVGCCLPGKWILHWGVNYIGDVGSEWDQPPPDMRPPGSIPIKDYAIETPLEKSLASSEGESIYEVNIDFNTNSSIAAINFVLKDEETGSWYQHRGRDFKVPLIDYLQDDGNIVGAKKGLGTWPGPLGQISNMLLKPEAANSKEDIGELSVQKRGLQGFYEEQAVVKEILVDNLVSVSVRHCLETAKNLLYIETDLPGDVIVHWGICKDDGKTWEIPSEPYPPETSMFKDKALRTLLQRKNGGHGSLGSFILDEGSVAFVFVLKLNENTWLNCHGNDFCIPLSSFSVPPIHSGQPHSEDEEQNNESGSLLISGNASEANQEVSAYTDEIIDEIRNLVTDISSEKNRKTKSKKAQESILQEIEKLAAEAYSIFRSSIPTFTETDLLEEEALEPPVKISSGTGSGFEILCQGFNWESHKSGKWYIDLREKASKLASLGFTVLWLPPPTDSVSSEGYMPRDLYNLNSRLTNVKMHPLTFQGRGNKSSGDNFHAAPNIDHSQEFVRKDIKEWLHWLREEIGYDGWRLDFVRGFWGGYVKDYIEATEPYFAVGEYWDSLSYTYGEMDHNQDAHRQRIIDWINATNGTAGAFDVTTKGILHSALERCEYWRLSDEKGKPPGVVGWWPSRAVTFIENHDTGSTQGHWRFPGGKEIQGYAYILTHPGTPSVFYDHIFSEYQSEISTLISIRNRNKIQCRSTVQIMKAERDVYAAMTDEKVVMKIGPGHYEPSNGSRNWSLVAEGRDYKIWETS